MNIVPTRYIIISGTDENAFKKTEHPDDGFQPLDYVYRHMKLIGLSECASIRIYDKKSTEARHYVNMTIEPRADGETLVWVHTHVMSYATLEIESMIQLSPPG